MNNLDYEIREICPKDSQLIASYIANCWGSPLSVSKGRILNTVDLPGFIYKDGDKVIGLLTYKIDEADCEIVTLNSEHSNLGLGTQLINKVIEKARRTGCNRVWLITTNDNTNALRFYQKRGFEWIGFYKNSMDESRKLKPEIHNLGEDGIPVKHEIEFELRL
nr:GNAT family N-acetyltransferase [uncultured Draconibacterium sp.]